MKLEVTINRKFYISVFVTAILLLGGAAVFAYNYQVNDASDPSAFGHSVDEMDWSKTIAANVSAEGFCIGDSCITAWPSNGVNGIVAGRGIAVTDTVNGVMINATNSVSTVSLINCTWVSVSSCSDDNCVPKCPSNKVMNSYHAGVSDNNVNRASAYCCNLVLG